jgi:hypothetical protein
MVVVFVDNIVVVLVLFFFKFSYLFLAKNVVLRNRKSIETQGYLTCTRGYNPSASINQIADLF